MYWILLGIAPPFHSPSAKPSLTTTEPCNLQFPNCSTLNSLMSMTMTSALSATMSSVVSPLRTACAHAVRNLAIISHRIKWQR